MFDSSLDQLMELAELAIFSDSERTVKNTIVGATSGVFLAVVTHKLTRNPFLVGIAAIASVVGAYIGSCRDLEIDSALVMRKGFFQLFGDNNEPLP